MVTVKTLNCILVALFIGSLAHGAATLTEQEQLDLLEAAEAYFHSSDRDHEESIGLYVEVLDAVELAPTIRFEILLNILEMLYTGPEWFGRSKAEELLPIAAQFEEIAQLGPAADWPVIQTHMFYGDIFGRLMDFESAAGEFLSAMELLSRVPPEEFEQFPVPGRSSMKYLLRRKLYNIHVRWGLEGVWQLEDFAQEEFVGPQIILAVREFAPELLDSHIQSLFEQDVQEMLRILEGLLAASEAVSPVTGEIPRHSEAKTPSREDIEKRRALGSEYPTGFPGYDKADRIPRVSVPRMLRAAFGVPFSVERVQRNRSTKIYLVPFGIQRNETLKHALDKFVAASDNRFEWRWIEDTIFIGPRKTGDPELATCLDAVISLELDSVSVWEAFVALGEAMAAKNPSEYPLYAVQPQCVANLVTPPDVFTQPGRVTLSLSGVTARRAACAIMKASPIKMFFKYSAGSDWDYVSLYFHEGMKSRLEELHPAYLDFWVPELKRVRERLADIAAR